MLRLSSLLRSGVLLAPRREISSSVTTSSFRVHLIKISTVLLSSVWCTPSTKSTVQRKLESS